MEESFYFALLRISVAQILKASGFDKCKPLVLNAVTGLYIKYLEKLLSKAKKFAVTRSNCTNEILAQDLTQALLDIQLIKPLSFESVLDPRDNLQEPDQEFNTKSLESFVRWVQFSDSYNLSKKLSEVPTSLIHNLAEKRKVDISAETDQERKKRRLRERQEYYNQIKHGEESAQVIDRLVDDLDDDEITSSDKLSWLAYLAEKDLKLGHNFKFASTSISDTVMSVHHNKKFHPPTKNGEDSYQVLQNHLHHYSKNDHVVLHIQEADDNESSTTQLQPSAELKDSLPYNLKYPDSLLSDDLQQYYKFAEEHPGEIEKTREVTEKKEAEPIDDDEILLGTEALSGEEKPVVTVLQEVAGLTGVDEAAEAIEAEDDLDEVKSNDNAAQEEEADDVKNPADESENVDTVMEGEDGSAGEPETAVANEAEGEAAVKEEEKETQDQENDEGQDGEDDKEESED